MPAMSSMPDWTQSERAAIKGAAFDAVFGKDGRGPDRAQDSWALKNMIQALSSLPALNSQEDWIRLATAREILRLRALKSKRAGSKHRADIHSRRNPRRSKKSRRLSKGRVVTRTVTSRTKTVTRTNPGLGDPRLKPYGLGFMPSSIGLRGYRGPVSFFSANGLSDKAKVLKRLFPEYTKLDHTTVARFHKKAELRYQALWSRTADRASKETFGRQFQFGDYKISGIARDEYPERYKKILRMAAHRGTDHANIAAAHEYAAKHMRLRK